MLNPTSTRRSGHSPLTLIGPLLGSGLVLCWLVGGTQLGAQVEEPQFPDRPRQGVEEVESLVNIDFRTDVRLFTVMAAVNLAGFDYEHPAKEMSELRKSVRAELADLDPQLLNALRAVYGSRRFRDAVELHTAYTSLALLLEGPPAFHIPESAPEIPYDVQRISGFADLLPQFYSDGKIDQLWLKYRPDYVQELERYRPVFRSVIQDTLRYFRIPARIVLDRQIVFIPDPLAFNDVVHARNLERTYYVVVGPAEDPLSNYVQLQHEYLHFLVDPIVEKHAGVIQKTRELLELAHAQPGLRSDFRGRYQLVVGESLIEALLFVLHPGADPDRAQRDIFRRGMVLTPFFLRALNEYQSSAEEISLPVFLEQTFAALSTSEVREDAAAIDRFDSLLEAESARQAAALEEARSQEEKRNERRQLQNRGIQSMLEKDYERSSEIFNELLGQNPADSSAMFYLAQVRGQQDRHEEALELYRRVEADEGAESWMIAWAKVRVGRFLASRGDYDSARERFQEVAGLPGDLQGAQDAARQALQALSQLKN